MGLGSPPLGAHMLCSRSLIGADAPFVVIALSGCDDGKRCFVDSECKSRVCSGGVCVAPTCEDDRHKGEETDLDCGGTCGGCAAGQACVVASDCAIGARGDGVCRGLETCLDGFKNQDETDIDCGADFYGPCASGRACVDKADCAAGDCVEGLCDGPASCTDGVQPGDETDVDCGGSCGACLGESWDAAAACGSRRCESNLCAEPTCDDGLMNGVESGVDCGVGCPEACATGTLCHIADDRSRSRWRQERQQDLGRLWWPLWRLPDDGLSV
ncbi:MAG: hypothetical protein ACI9MR_003648 [Myxococcota bacterium]|jgi:hypothetical protein